MIKPKRELFGENLSDITQYVFLTNESDHDFKETLDRLLADNNYNPALVEEIFDNNLGRAARIYLASRAESIIGDKK